MNVLPRIFTLFTFATGVFASTLYAPSTSHAYGEPAGYVFYGHYHDAATAYRIAGALSQGHDSRYDAGWAESRPHPVNRTFGVYARPRQTSGPVLFAQHGSLTRGHAMDRIRQGCHAVTYPVTLSGGRRYQIDLVSPQGTGFFDGWLRLEDASGNVLASDDDSGDGLNARILHTPNASGAYRIVVTSYARGAAGAFHLTVR